MRPWTGLALVLACSCNAAGTELPSDAGGGDVTVDAASYDGGATAPEAGADADEPPEPCVDLNVRGTVPWTDCVYVGRCPFDCAGGTASAYVCTMAAEAGVPTYPSVFNANVDVVDVVASLAATYPWDAAAYESCAALACTRWSTADHVDGGSQWPSDPCADGGVATEAWACPPSPGVVPPSIGCFAAGDMQDLGGAGTGISTDRVWCCPSASALLDGGAGGAVIDSPLE